MKKITILGSTGSIGANTLRVISEHPEKFSVYALTAYSNLDLLTQQCIQYRPQVAVIHDADAAKKLAIKLREVDVPCEILIGAQGLSAVASAPEVDMVMAAIVGAAGLVPTLMAARAGKRVLLANKEALVMAGSLFMQTVRKHHAELLPIDSEHNAIFQCLPQNFASSTAALCGIRKIILTASGGPFLTTPLDLLSQVTAQQAYTHPNWVMGRKISIDSATMMNKALEIIEAHYLFGLKAQQIEVMIHPQSIVHSMVEYNDGSVLAEMANPDMRVPIAYGLAWPERIVSGVNYLELLNTRLDFQALDNQRYPCLQLAYQALQEEGTSSAILNAANEVAVAAFLADKIVFTDIFHVVNETLMKVVKHSAAELEQILDDDAKAREFANNYILILQNHKTTRYNAPNIEKVKI